MKMKLHLLSRGAAVFFAASSSLSLPSVVSAAEAAVVAAAAASSDDLKLTRRQLSNSYTGNHRALMRDDEHPSEEKPDVASIINGRPTGGPLSYQVGLVRGSGKLPNCGGSIIAPRVVLTAAHCTRLPIDPPANKVLINGYDLSSFDNGIPYGGGIVQVNSQVDHPDYNSTTYENDISLWFLSFPIGEDEHFKFATLNEDPNVPADGEELFMSGWGNTSPYPGDQRSPILLGTNVDYITNEQCIFLSKFPFNTDGMMCAVAGNGITGPCIGDSGGPLVIANGTAPAMDPTIQVGIASWVGPNCNPNLPTGYTRVSYYVDWIRSTACQEVGELCHSSSKSGKGKSKSYKSDRP